MNIIPRKTIILFSVVIILLLSNFSSCEKRVDPDLACKVYKTKGDYFNLVPILLSEDKTKILAVPDPSDLCHIYKDDSIWQKPSRLLNDYLLDHRGIWLNVAFLDMTYEEYMVYSDTLVPLESILTIIKDDDPLLEFYYDEEGKVGRDTTVINNLIKKGELEKYFTRLK